MTPGSPDHEWREDCAPRRVLDIFASKWTSMILHVLHIRLDGCARTGVLLRSLPGISKKMLTQTLRDMETAGLVARRVYGTVPPAVDYTLTPARASFRRADRTALRLGSQQFRCARRAGGESQSVSA
jgi:DNA-binding HxlR family transcriptional regulator